MEETAVLEPEVLESSGESSGESTPTPEREQPETPQQKRESEKAYQAWLKGLREDGDGGKFARRAKDDYGRLQAIQRLEARGYDGVREKYELLNGLAHGDKQGVEAIPAMQEALAESRAVLDAITSGDPGAFTSLSEEQQLGVSRLTPAILDHLASTAPEAYTAAMLPHFMGALQGSELTTEFNGLVSTLLQKPPAWMTPDQKTSWVEDKINAITQNASRMQQWFKAQEERLKELGGKEKAGPQVVQTQGPSEETKAYWSESVYPQTNAHAEQQFTSLMKPWEDRLAKAGIRLSNEKKTALAQEFVAGVVTAANANAEYKKQMGFYNKQRKPDSGSVISTFKAEFNKHGLKTMENLIRRDYGQILEKGKKTAPVAPGRQTSAAPDKGVRLVSVKPSRDNINFQRTTTDMIYRNEWFLKDGSRVQYRPN